MIVSSANQDALDWLSAKAGCWLSPKARGVAAIDERGVRGVVGYDLWTPNSCHIHVAIDAPIVARRLVGPALSYPFQQLGLGLVLAVLPEGTGPSRGLLTKVGFKAVSRIRDGWEPGQDMVFFQLRREEWLSRRTA